MDRFSKFFHQIIRRKILYVGYISQRFPPHQQYVATLPCEIRNLKMLPHFHTERDNYFCHFLLNILMFNKNLMSEIM